MAAARTGVSQDGAKPSFALANGLSWMTTLDFLAKQDCVAGKSGPEADQGWFYAMKIKTQERIGRGDRVRRAAANGQAGEPALDFQIWQESQIWK